MDHRTPTRANRQARQRRGRWGVRATERQFQRWRKASFMAHDLPRLGDSAGIHEIDLRVWRSVTSLAAGSREPRELAFDRTWTYVCGPLSVTTMVQRASSC